MSRALVVLVLAALVFSALLVLSLRPGSPPSGAAPVATVLQVGAGLTQHPAAWVRAHRVRPGCPHRLAPTPLYGPGELSDAPAPGVPPEHAGAGQLPPACARWTCGRFTVQWGGAVPFAATVACPTCTAAATDFVLQQPGSSAILPLSRITALPPAPPQPLLTVVAGLPFIGQEQPTLPARRRPYGWGVYPLAIVRQGHTIRLALADPRY